MSDDRPFPIQNYDELNAGDVTAALEGLTPEQLVQVREHETAGQARVTVLRAIDHLITPPPQPAATAPYPDPPEGRPPLGELAEKRASYGADHQEA